MLYGIALASALFYTGANIPLLLSVCALMVLLACAALLTRAAALRFPAYAAWLGALTGAAWASVAWSGVPYATVLVAWTFSAFGLGYLAFAIHGRSDGQWRALQAFLAILAVALVAYQLAQAFLLDQDTRATFAYRVSLAGFLALIGLTLLPRVLMASGRRAWIWGVILVAIGTGVALTLSRGAMVGLAAALVLLWIFSLGLISRRRLLIAYAYLIAGLLIGNLLQGGMFTERLGTLGDPDQAGHDRFLIWGGALRMLSDHWLTGSGFGTFWLRYPAFRAPEESSAGFYVHNDYLQFLVELGIVGLALLLGFLAAVAWRGVRALRSEAVPAPDRLELAALLAGFGALCVHTFFDYHFYILPTLILLGVVLARIHHLTAPLGGGWSLPLGLGARRLVALGLAAAAAAYLVPSFMGQHALYQAEVAMAAGDTPAADAELRSAARLLPAQDLPLLARAKLLLHVRTEVAALSATEREVLEQEIDTLLDQAERLNPWRADAHAMRGRLLALSPGRAAEAESAFERALTLNPNYLIGRLDYAQFLLHDRHDEARAQAVLERGTVHYYPASRDLQALYSLLADVRAARGDAAGARAARERLREIGVALERARAG